MSRKISSTLGLAVAGSMLAMAASSVRAKGLCRQLHRQYGERRRHILWQHGCHYSGGYWPAWDGDQPSSRVYIAGDGSSSLNVIDTASDRVTKTIEVGKKPGITLTPAGKLLLVSVYDEDRIALVDTVTNEVVGTIPV